MKKFTWIALAAIPMIVAACNQMQEKEAVNTEQSSTDLASPEEKDKQYAAYDNEREFPGDSTINYKQADDNSIPKTATSNNPDWDRKIVKEGTIRAEVEDLGLYYIKLREKVRGLGGYISAENQLQDEYKKQNTVIIKVPVAQFDQAMFDLASAAKTVEEKIVTSQDVTAEFVDTRSRIEARKEVRGKYVELLRQAKSMKDILEVQKEINSIHEEIESATGRVNYLGQASAYSTININFYQSLAPVPNKDHPGFGERLANAFKSGGQWTAELLIGLATLWPIWLLVMGLIIWFRKGRTNKKATDTIPPVNLQ